MTPDLVIFDCDGVLVDTEPRSDVILTRNLARHGYVLDPSRPEDAHLGGTLRGMAETLRGRGVNLPDDWLDEIYGEIYADFRKGVAEIPGARDVVDALIARGTAIAIASNGPMTKMEITLPPSGLWDRFAGRIYSGYDHAPKPAPDMLLHACAAAGVDRTGAVFIDDSPTGCTSARNAGMTCLGFAATGNSADLAAVGAVPVADMTAVAARLGLA